MQLQNFYSFVSIQDCAKVQTTILEYGIAHGILGTVLLAEEGINAAVCGEDAPVCAFVAFLEKLFHTSFTPFVTHIPPEKSLPFKKFKVRIKPEIVALGMPYLNPGHADCAVGTYVDPWQWNNIIRNESTIVIDTRNTYEYCLGHFKNAIDPDTRIFKEFPEYIQTHFPDSKKPTIAMYCTGGIRCEKASALLRSLQFDTVYQLQGGILEYFAVIPPKESLWEGGCFVFDDRVVIDSTMNTMPISFSDIPQKLQEYKTTSQHANHIYKKIIGMTTAI